MPLSKTYVIDHGAGGDTVQVGMQKLDDENTVVYSELDTVIAAAAAAQATADAAAVAAAAAMTTGMINMWPTSTPPAGWLLCNGQAVSRATYSALFALIGTTYGFGDGSTTFNVPDLKGRVAVGLDAGQAEFDALGETGGEKAHVQTEAEMAQHSHVAFPKMQTVETGASGSSIRVGFDVGTPGSLGVALTATAGSGQAANVLQPYLTLNFVIKT